MILLDPVPDCHETRALVLRALWRDRRSGRPGGLRVLASQNMPPTVPKHGSMRTKQSRTRSPIRDASCLAGF